MMQKFSHMQRLLFLFAVSVSCTKSFLPFLFLTTYIKAYVSRKKSDLIHLCLDTLPFFLSLIFPSSIVFCSGFYASLDPCKNGSKHLLRPQPSMYVAEASDMIDSRGQGLCVCANSSSPPCTRGLGK